MNIKYVLSYTLFTGIVQGEKQIYAKRREKEAVFDVATEEEMAAAAAAKWQEILYNCKEPNAAVQFVALMREVDWKPPEELVEF